MSQRIDDAVRRSAIESVAVLGYLDQLEGSVNREGVADRAPFPVGCHDKNVCETPKRVLEAFQTFGFYPIVVGEENK